MPDPASHRLIRRAFLLVLALSLFVVSRVPAEIPAEVPVPPPLEPGLLPPPPVLVIDPPQTADDSGERPDPKRPGIVVDPLAPPPVTPSAATQPRSVVHEIPGGTLTHFPEENWSVVVMPRAKSDMQKRAADYRALYASLPFHRAEYLANPGYRHEATMELLMGQLRPKTIVSNYTPQVIPTPTFDVYQPYRYSQTELYYRWRPAIGGYNWGFHVAPSYPAYPPLAPYADPLLD